MSQRFSHFSIRLFVGLARKQLQHGIKPSKKYLFNSVKVKSHLLTSMQENQEISPMFIQSEELRLSCISESEVTIKALTLSKEQDLQRTSKPGFFLN